jgi:epoxyqueuosine reductase
MLGFLPSVTNHEQTVERTAAEAGFARVGFSRIKRLNEREAFYTQWLRQGRHAAMHYLAREPERRFDPRAIDKRFKSVISLLWPYAPPSPPVVDWRAELRGRIAAYALGPDYHDYVLKGARVVSAAIESLCPGGVTRTYVDTGPVFEREWAARARLGWFGKNTMLLTRERGSYFFLAEVFTDVEFDGADAPYREHCGTCRQCLELCPTQALKDGYVMEPRECISYLTIENRGPIPRELRAKVGMWLFGCDICQEVCPWNPHAPGDGDDNLMPRLLELMALDDFSFSRRFSKSAIKRAKRRGLLRNAAVVLGNTGNRDAVPALTQVLEQEPEALVRSHAAWALGELGGRTARHALERARQRDIDTQVVEEARAGLDRNVA